jgi:hypothetical protein
MFLRIQIRSLQFVAASLLLLVLFLFSGCGSSIPGIAHKNIVPAKFAAVSLPDISAIGEITSLKEFNGVLYAGARKGLAAINSSGQIVWTLDLPLVNVRMIDVDGECVAFTNYSIVGINEATGFKGFAFGDLGDKPEISGAGLGLVSIDGKLLWSGEYEEQTIVSPPALSKNGVGVCGSKSFFLYDKKSGQQLSRISMFTKMLGISETMALQAPCLRPAVLNDEYFVSHFMHMKRIDAQGKELASLNKYGLKSPFQDITAGPVVFKNMILFGNAPTDLYSNLQRSKIFASKSDTKLGWAVTLADKISSVSSIATNKDFIFAATNFSVSAIAENGKILWTRKNEKGGLYPGVNRGVRYISSNFATLKSPGAQMVATENCVFITSDYTKDQNHKVDLITVLDAKTGEYIESINMDTQVFDMTLFGSQIALATFDGIKLITR